MNAQGYAEALDELEALHRAGKISDARYELHKTKLMNEATRPRQNPVWRFVSGVGIGLIVLLLLLVALRILGAGG